MKIKMQAKFKRPRLKKKILQSRYGWLMPTETEDDLRACRQLFFLLLKPEIWMDTKTLIFDEEHLVLKYAQLELYLLYLSEKVSKNTTTHQ